MVYFFSSTLNPFSVLEHPLFQMRTVSLIFFFLFFSIYSLIHYALTSLPFIHSPHTHSCLLEGSSVYFHQECTGCLPAPAVPSRVHLFPGRDSFVSGISHLMSHNPHLEGAFRYEGIAGFVCCRSLPTVQTSGKFNNRIATKEPAQINPHKYKPSRAVQV